LKDYLTQKSIDYALIAVQAGVSKLVVVSAGKECIKEGVEHTIKGETKKQLVEIFGRIWGADSEDCSC